MSRRGFLRNVLGVTAAIIVPTQLIASDPNEIFEKFFVEKLDAGKIVTCVNDWIRRRMWEDSFPRLFLLPDPILNCALQHGEK